MSNTWNEIDWTAETGDNNILPENTEFVFELLKGAKYGKFNPNRIELGAKVVEGEFKGAVNYFSYPDPKEQAWVPGVFRRLCNAIVANDVEDIQTDEDPVDFLTRSAGSKFRAPVRHRTRTYEGADEQVAEIKIGNIKPPAKS